MFVILNSDSITCQNLNILHLCIEEGRQCFFIIFRSVKNSVADFFGLGDEDCQQSSKWQNRHMRYYRGKVKDGYLNKTTDFDELDSSIRYIHDPLKGD